jgi:hypothetical protein
LNLSRKTQKAIAFTVILLAATLCVAALNSATAQTPPADQEAIVIILPSAGGTTNPPPGNYTYGSNETINLEAIPNEGTSFAYWIVSGALTPGHEQQSGGFYTDPETGAIVQLPNPVGASAIDSLVFNINPANITCGYGYTYTYQAVFASNGSTIMETPQPQTQNATSDSAGVTILPSVGGTTTPPAGNYSYQNGTTYTLSATADEGFVFHYWLVYGTYQPGHLAQPNYVPGVTEQFPSIPENIYQPTVDSLIFSINPVTITCGYGYNYTYQAVFDPVNASGTPLPTTTPQSQANQTDQATQSPDTTQSPAGSETPASTPTDNGAAPTSPSTTTELPTSMPTETMPTLNPEVTPTPAEDLIFGLSMINFVIIIVVVVIIIIAVAVALMSRRNP